MRGKNFFCLVCQFKTVHNIKIVNSRVFLVCQVCGKKSNKSKFDLFKWWRKQE
jgi:transcription elongation factor Elf1